MWWVSFSPKHFPATENEIYCWKLGKCKHDVMAQSHSALPENVSVCFEIAERKSHENSPVGVLEAFEKLESVTETFPLTYATRYYMQMSIIDCFLLHGNLSRCITKVDRLCNGKQGKLISTFEFLNRCYVGFAVLLPLIARGVNFGFLVLRHQTDVIQT